MALQCTNCKIIIRNPVEEINILTATDGRRYCTHCAKIKFENGEPKIIDLNKGLMEEWR